MQKLFMTGKRSCKSKLLVASTSYFLLLFAPVFNQFPRRCTDTATIASRRCCPVGNDGSECSQASGRGNCTLIRPELANFVLNKVPTMFERYKVCIF